MELFDVYQRYDVVISRAEGCRLYDDADREYLDLYGGHGVISIGHGHEAYVQAIEQQVRRLGFYSNSIEIPIQCELAKKLGEVSGYRDYRLFLCNSGAEANENALKLASFQTGKKGVIAFKGSFHGRTTGAFNITDCVGSRAPINVDNVEVEWVDLGDEAGLMAALTTGKFCAVIVEGIQGVGGLDMPSIEFLQFMRTACDAHDALLILDEVQSGYGRTGEFFAHQYAGVRPDLITIAKGMGNGFPVAGVLIHPGVESKHGMLGTTFGGNPLACAAALSVLEVIEGQGLIEQAKSTGRWLSNQLRELPGVQEVKGRGLMLGVVCDALATDLRSELLYEHRVVTGGSNNPHLLRVLPPLTITESDLSTFISALDSVLCKTLSA